MKAHWSVIVQDKEEQLLVGDGVLAKIKVDGTPETWIVQVYDGCRLVLFRHHAKSVHNLKDEVLDELKRVLRSHIAAFEYMLKGVQHVYDEAVYDKRKSSLYD